MAPNATETLPVLSILQQHINAVQACRQCPTMQSLPVTGQAVYSQVMLLNLSP
jgi:hypothetical protein